MRRGSRSVRNVLRMKLATSTMLMTQRAACLLTRLAIQKK
jgi:hypothetical protein